MSKVQKSKIKDFIKAIIKRYTTKIDLDNFSLSPHLSPSLNQSDDSGMSSLPAAVQSGDLRLISELIERGANVHAYDKQGYTVLHQACFAGDIDNIEVIKLLLANGADINCRSAYNTEAKIEGGLTPAYCATLSDNYALLKFLLENGADVNARTDDTEPDSMRVTLLQASCSCSMSDEENLATVRLLLEHGASLGGVNLLFIGYVAESSATWSIPVMRLLLEYGAAKYINLPSDLYEHTALHCAVGAINTASREILKLLLDNGAKAGVIKGASERRYYERLYQLHAENNQHVLIPTIEPDAHIDTHTHNSLKLYYDRIINMIKLLLEAGSDVNARDRFGKTVLQYVVDAIRQQERQEGQESHDFENDEDEDHNRGSCYTCDYISAALCCCES